jgi:hypothetical protein
VLKLARTMQPLTSEGQTMASFVEFENSQGRKFLVNPDQVVSVTESNKESDPVSISLASGNVIGVKQTYKEVKAKLGVK